MSDGSRADTSVSALVGKHGTRGPRYTSYPTALQFDVEFDRELARRQWIQCRATPTRQGPARLTPRRATRGPTVVSAPSRNERT